MKLRKPSFETSILIAIYAMVFLYFIFQKPIFSPDSFSYLNAMPHRNPGYVIFVKFFEFVFSKNYAQVIVGMQLAMGLLAVHIFLKRMSKLLNLNHFLKIVLLLALLLPFFPPLLVANNICSEGLSYPLYLLFLVLGFEFIQHEKRFTLPLLLILYLLLVLTRGQFIVTSTIFAFVYFFKYTRCILEKKHLFRLVVIILFPLIVMFADKTYHQLKEGYFIPTPYTFVNMSSAAFYVSKESDVSFMENDTYKAIFESCYNRLKEKNLLMSSKTRDGYDEYYEHFHNHVPQICNQTIHDLSKGYYYDKYLETNNDKNAASAYSMWQSEVACKSMFFTLVKNNFKDWSLLYYSNLVHGFKSIVLLLFVLSVLFYSGFKVISKNEKLYNILFICSALTISNALIVSLASHSIMRYLFYNYILMFFMIVILIKLSINAKRN